MLPSQVRFTRVGRWVLLLFLLSAIACNLPNLGARQQTAQEPTAEPSPTVDVASLPPTSPKVVAQRPYEGEELPLDGSIDIYFDQPMDQASVEEAVSVEPALDVNINWVNDSTMRLTPASGELGRAERYTITIADTADAANGLSMETPAEVDVQTVGFLQASEVVPAPDASSVAADSVITVLFNRPVVPLGVAEDAPDLPQPLSFSPDIPGTGEWINTSIYQWQPSEPLEGDTTYTVTVGAGLEDQTGGVMEEDYSWSFSVLPPDVTSVEPAAESDPIPLDTPITVVFNQPVNQPAIQQAFSLTPDGGQPVNGSFSWSDDGQTMTFQPSSLLALGTGYTASLNAEGTDLLRNVDWSFPTVPAPAVLNTVPAQVEEKAQVYGGLHINFSAPMDEDTLDMDMLTVEPALPSDTTTFYSSYDNSWNINTILEPSTEYTVTLAAGAADPYGNTISEPYTWSFTTAPLDPMVQFNTQSQFGLYDASRTTELFVLHRNVSDINFRLYSMPLETFVRQSANYGTPSPDNANLVREWSVEVENELNVNTYLRLPVASEEGGSLDPGVYVLTAKAPSVQTVNHYMIVVTDNLTFKASFNESLTWLTDLEDGQPVEGVDVTVYNMGFSALGSGTTDADGVAQVSGYSVDNLWDSQYAVAEGNGHFAVAMSDWDQGIQPWEFGSIPTTFQPERYSLYAYTDRPIYRPGQTVYFKGILRSKDDMTYSLPDQQQITATVYNSQGDIVSQSPLNIDELGTFDGSIDLDAEADLGYYTIEFRVGDLQYNQGFQVAEYRVPEFVVEVTPEANQVLAGGEVNVTVDSQFYFGGPVSDAEVTWTVLSAPYTFSPEVPGHYSFGDYNQDQRNSDNYVPGFGEVIANGTGQTDANGQYVITIPANLDDEDTSRRFTVEATVTDINEQQVSGRSEVIVHKGQIYAGVQPELYVVEADGTFSTSVLALDWNANPVADREVTVELVKQTWYSVQEEDDQGRTQWTWELEQEVVGDPVTVTTDEDGKASVDLTPPQGGSYKVRASVTDDAGNTQRSSAFVWVYGSQFVSWRQTNNNRIDLIADRDNYTPGDTAEILIASPFQGNDVQALVTVERGGIISHDVITLESNSTVYEVPITGDLAPNVFVSVVIVKGVDDSNTVPAFRMGLVELSVEPVEQTLEISVTPDRSMVGPGEEVTYTVRAADYQGDPVDAEISLALVDLATLALAQPNSGPILDHFYGTAMLGVRTSVPLSNLVNQLNQELFDEGKGGGGGGGEGFFDIRSEFEDTAFWEATLRTGDDGVAEVSITLPDNLTTWRMDARAVTADTLVGQETVDIVASRPLLIRPNTPRFFVVGDDATVSAVVNNNTEDAIDASVRLDVTGVSSVSDELTQQVSIPAGGRTEVAWDVTVDSNAEWVDMTFNVEGGGLTDASKPTLGDPDHDRMLPVYRYDVPETVGTAGQLDAAGERVEGIVLPPTYDVVQGNVTVQVDPSLAAATVDGLDYLKHYPYECTEQTVSRFLPNALTLRALNELGIEDANLEQSLNTQLSTGLQRLYAQQHVDGGWGWFVTSDSNPAITAYVVQGLLAARDAGYEIEQRVLDDAVNYLSGQLEPLDNLSAQRGLHTQAHILYVLAEAGEPDVSRTVQLYENRQSMQHWARALLAQALWNIDPNDERLANIQSDLTNSAILSATGAHWEEESNDVFNLNTDTRSTAIILDTYARLWPESDLGPNIVRWLMVARQGGHWETTQETAWALIGLTHWMSATGELNANYQWTFSFNGQEMADGSASRENIRESEQIVIDVSQLLQDEVNRLVFDRTEGEGQLYYTAHLTAYLPVEEVEALSRGIIVSRRYLDADGNPVTSGSVGDTLTVELTIVAPHDLYYVVVEDPYPAGAEAVNINLETESVLGQRPTLQPADPLAKGWGWWYFSQTDLRDEKAVMFADHLAAGTYQYTYQVRLSLPGEYRVIPPAAREFYLPEVYGRGAGSIFTIGE